MNINYIQKNLSIAVLAFGMLFASLAQSAPPAGSRYYTDIQQRNNDDQTTQAFGIVKTVTCVLDKLHPEYNANNGSYVAWVKANECDTSQTITTASSAIPYSKFTVLPTYDPNTQVLNVKMWGDDWNNDSNNGVVTYTPQFLWVNVDIQSGPALTPPLGTWSMQYCEQDHAGASSLAQDPSTCSSHGFATVTPQKITVWQSSSRAGVVTERDAGVATYTVSDGKVVSGQGQFQLYDAWNGASSAATNNYLFSFSGDNYGLKTNSSAPICMNRNITTSPPFINSWQGNLYDESGNLVNLNGGFNLKLAPGPVSDWSRTGWVSYWGPGFPAQDAQGNSISITPGQTLYGNQSSNMDAPYTYKATSGSLQKVTVTQSTFNAFKNQRFMVWFSGSQNPLSSGDGNYQVYWDGTQFVSEGKFGSDGQSLVTTNTQTISLSALAALRMYSLNGNVPNGPGINFRLGQWIWANNAQTWAQFDPASPSANNPAYAYQTIWTDIYPGVDTNGAVDLASQNLVCYGGSQNCPTASADNTLQSSSGWQAGSSTPITYSWDDASGNLSQSNHIASSSTQRSIGPLFLSSDSTVATNYACSPTTGGSTQNGQNGYWDSNNTFHAGGVCTGNAWNIPGTFYMWNTNTSAGSTNWPNRGFIVDANGKRPAFDKPISVTYVPTTGTLAGTTQVLTYNGAGQFWIPQTCFDKNTHQPIQCGGSSNNTFWSDNYEIPFDPVLGVVSSYSNPSTKYYVKFIGQSYLYSTQNADCSSLTVPASTTLPTEADWADPHASGGKNFIGAFQAPNQSPKYVDGVQQ